MNAPLEFKPIQASWAAELKVFSPAGASELEAPADFLLFFAKNAAEAKCLAADINRDTLWPIFESFGYRPNRQVAVDDDWSALRFGKM